MNNNSKFQSKYSISHYEGCLKGGAIGDALGWPVEFYSIEKIKNKFGQTGIQNLLINSKGKAEITDDTQMTIFTADGLIKSLIKKSNIDEMPDMKEIFNSYKLWFNTQYSTTPKKGYGWISEIKELYVSRAPGNTCLSVTRGNISGSIIKPINNSAGCGGVMRVAPVGLIYKDNPELAFKVGSECAALTHGHPRGYLSGGILSEIISFIINGKNILEAVIETLKTLKTYRGHEPTTDVMEKAIELANTETHPSIAIPKLGEGWVGDEAIAIATYCSLKEPHNFEKAVKLAVNHSGDSDSTGAILGNILGAYLGIEQIPSVWIEQIELTDELGQLAEDLYSIPHNIKNLKHRYPSN